MKTLIYSIYDSKVAAYMQPFFMQTNAAAIRAFSELAADKQTSVGKYPSDYTLFAIGEFHEDSGRIDSYQTPISLGLALEHVAQNQNPLQHIKQQIQQQQQAGANN